METFIFELLDRQDKNAAIEGVQKTIRMLLTGQIPASKLVLSKKLSRTLETHTTHP